MKEIREMVVANQNETVRKSCSTQNNVYLATIGLIGCVCVIFYSKKRECLSLTHADAATNFDFLKKEYDWVGHDCKSFLIYNQGDLKTKVRELILKLGIRNVEMYVSTDTTVLFNHEKQMPQFFKLKDFINLATPGVKPDEHNKLLKLGYHPTFSEPNMFKIQLRTYTRQLNAAVSDNRCQMPLLVHNESGWLKTECLLADDVIIKIKENKINDRTSYEYVWPKYQKMMLMIETKAQDELLKPKGPSISS